MLLQNVKAPSQMLDRN